MGYILPVNFYQYQHYQDRIKGVKINHYRTVGIEKVKKTYLLRIDSFSKEKYSADKRLGRQSGNKADQVYAQLTGIGRNFNEKI